MNKFLLSSKNAWFLLILFFTFDNFFSYFAITQLNAKEANLVIAYWVETYPFLYFFCIPITVIIMYFLALLIRKIILKIFNKNNLDKKIITQIILTSLVLYWAIANSSINLAFLLGYKQSIRNWYIVSVIGIILGIIYGLISLVNYLKSLKQLIMKILIFVEGTILMHASAQGKSRAEIVKQSQAAGIQREERYLAYDAGVEPAAVPKGSVYDLASYIPVGQAAAKLQTWSEQGAEICYLSSRRLKSELETISKVLQKYHFPQIKNFYFRNYGQDYKDVALKIMPDILIEDDCQSIGGEDEMTYTHLDPQAKTQIKLIAVQEFAGIDHLPDRLEELKKYES